MSNMTAYEMLSGFINYFMYKTTDFSKEDIASALLELSEEFNDAGIVQELRDRVKLLKAALKYSNTTIKCTLPFIKIACDARIVSEIEEMLSKTNEVLR